MELLAVIAVFAVAVGIGLVITGRRNRQRRPELLPKRSPADEQRMLHGDVRRLKPGDVVAYEGTDYLVDRTMRFDEDGFTWNEHLLTDAAGGGRKLWLSVEDDEGVEVAVYETLAGVVLDPASPSLTHDGVTYRREEGGRARFRVERSDGPGEEGTMEYADFSSGDRLLAFEKYGSGGWEVSTGQVISEHVLDIYPAS